MVETTAALVNDVFETIGFHSAGSRHWIRDGWFVEVPDFDITDPTVTVEVVGHALTMVIPESVLIARLVESDQTGHTGTCDASVDDAVRV